MPDNKKRRKTRPKRLSKNNNLKNKSKKEDQEAKKVLLGKKKLYLKETERRGYTFNPETDFGNLEFSVMKKASDDYQQRLVRRFQTVKEAAKGAFKCALHNFDTDYYDAWNDHLVEKKHFFDGSLICKKCGKPKVLKNFPITKQGFKKVKRLRCDKCKKYLMIKLIRDSWGIIYPEVLLNGKKKKNTM